MPLFNSHATYLKKFWQEKNFPTEFFIYGLLGTLLPDIRYLLKIPRAVTHLHSLENQSLTGEKLYQKLLAKISTKIKSDGWSPTQKEYFGHGLAFHITLDKWWPKQIYFSSDSRHIGLCLRLIDEKLKFEQIKHDKWIQSALKADWLKLITGLQFLDLKTTDLKKWFMFVKKYFLAEANNIDQILIASKFLPPEIAAEVFTENKKIAEHQPTISKLNSMSKKFSWEKISLS